MRAMRRTMRVAGETRMRVAGSAMMEGKAVPAPELRANPDGSRVPAETRIITRTPPALETGRRQDAPHDRHPIQPERDHTRHARRAPLRPGTGRTVPRF